jgi:hypothetical protein
MKIKDIIKEDVDMSWWRDLDAQRQNTEANHYVSQQEKRSELLQGNSDATPVFTKPVRQSQDKFSNKPPKDGVASPGYLGHKEVQVRARHISKDKAREITGLDLPRTPGLPAKDPYAP